MTSRHDNEQGLTLVEMMIAIFVISIILMAMAATAIAAQRSMQVSERVVHATQLGNELLETYLARDFEDLGLYSDDANAAFGGATTYDGDNLVVFPQPTAPDYTRVPRAQQDINDRGGVTYVARTAVVWTSDLDPTVTDQFKRIIVELSWQVRGSARTTTVEALVARNPADQMLTVVIEPDTVAIDANGVQINDFTITVTARDPQSIVNVVWEDRDGFTVTTNLVDQGGGVTWARTVSGKTFANGGTLFTVTGTLAGTTQKNVTTIGRALFLQPLEFATGQTTVAPAQLSYHPETGYCEAGIRVESVANGAIFSDPMTATFNTLAYPMEAVDPPLTAGTLYRVDLELTDLNIATGDTMVQGSLKVTRPTGATEVSQVIQLDIPIAVLPLLGTDAAGNPVYQSCP